MSKKTYNIVKELNYNENNKLILSSETVCSYCLDNQDIIYFDINESNTQRSSLIKDTVQTLYVYDRYNQNIKFSTPIPELIKDKIKVIYLYRKIEDIDNSAQIIKNSIIQQGYNLEREDSVDLYDYIIFNKIDK